MKKYDIKFLSKIKQSGLESIWVKSVKEDFTVIHNALKEEANFPGRDKLVLALLNHYTLKTYGLVPPKDKHSHILFSVEWLEEVLGNEFPKYHIALEKFKLRDYSDEEILNAFKIIGYHMLKYEARPSALATSKKLFKGWI